jgi:hypothetical protein
VEALGDAREHIIIEYPWRGPIGAPVQNIHIPVSLFPGLHWSATVFRLKEGFQMIRGISFDSSPMAPGEERELILSGDGPFTVAYKCFVFEPPPPDYKECAECTVYTVAENAPFRVKTPETSWPGGDGEFEIRIGDAVGDKRTIRVPIIPTTTVQASVQG